MFKHTGSKIISYVGNITTNKNQILLVETINKYFKNENVICVLFGRECDDGHLRKYITQNELENKVFLCGFCEELDSIWPFVDINVLLSKNEGFGLSIVEGYIRGIPSVIGRNIDAALDLYNPETCMLTDYELTSVQTSIQSAMIKEWNKTEIERFGHIFSLQKMASNYIDIYTEMIHDKINVTP